MWPKEKQSDVYPPEVDRFPLTAHPKEFYSSHITAICKPLHFIVTELMSYFVVCSYIQCS